MQVRTLVDAGPLIGWLNASDADESSRIKNESKTSSGPSCLPRCREEKRDGRIVGKNADALALKNLPWPYANKSLWLPSRVNFTSVGVGR